MLCDGMPLRLLHSTLYCQARPRDPIAAMRHQQESRSTVSQLDCQSIEIVDQIW
jgi:hypothetical protein